MNLPPIQHASLRFAGPRQVNQGRPDITDQNLRTLGKLNERVDAGGVTNDQADQVFQTLRQAQRENENGFPTEALQANHDAEFALKYPELLDD